MCKLVLEKAEEPEIKSLTSARSSKEQENSRKTSFLLYWLRQSLWLHGSHQTVENSSEICMQVKKQQLELDMEQQTGSK